MPWASRLVDYVTKRLDGLVFFQTARTKLFRIGHKSYIPLAYSTLDRNIEWRTFLCQPQRFADQAVLYDCDLILPLVRTILCADMISAGLVGASRRRADLLAFKVTVHGSLLPETIYANVDRVDLFDMSPMKGQRADYELRKNHWTTHNNIEIPPLHSLVQLMKGQSTGKASRGFLRRGRSPLESSSSSEEDFRFLLVEDFSGPEQKGRVA